MVDFWSDSNWVTSDRLNSVVWRLSPALTWRLHGGRMLTEAGDVGVEQAMVPGPDCPLPWVPDLIGTDSRNEHGVIVVGSAYSPFIDGLAGRRATMSCRTYQSTAVNRRGWPAFQEAFRAEVIRADTDYYPVIEKFFTGLLNPNRLTIFDLCRGSFCRRGSRPDHSHEHPYFDAGGDGVALCNPGLFRAYTEAKVPDRWLWERMTQTKATVIVALGFLAEHGLLRLFWRHGYRTIYRSQDARSTWQYRSVADWPKNRYAHRKFGTTWWAHEGDWWIITDAWGEKRWKLLPLPHPQYRKRERRDEAYAAARSLIGRMLSI